MGGLIMDFKFIQTKNYPVAKKSGERKLNDIIEVNKNGIKTYRIFLNDDNTDNNIKMPEEYVEIHADENILIALKPITWTLDNSDRDAKLVKSATFQYSCDETIYLRDILINSKHGTEFDIKENDDINEKVYIDMRKKFINENLKWH